MQVLPEKIELSTSPFKRHRLAAWMMRVRARP
jgi:hypothetical protein